MASTMATTTPDTLVTIKVSLDGTTRRFKLPLRDLGASTLERQLRSFLSIAPSTDCVFERYSDSAASYVILDPANNSVYKQLYRAAKAKQKLKLRVTVKAEPAKEAKGPKPVSVEDELETPQFSASGAEPQQAESPKFIPSASVTNNPSFAQPALRTSAYPQVGSAAPRKLLASMEREQKQMERNLELLEASVAKLKLQPAGVPIATPSSFNLAAQPCGPVRPVSMSIPPPAPRVSPVSLPRPTFAVCCNSCDRTIPESHYHCSTCDDGDFDLCQDCVDKGISCYGADHWLIKRTIKNGAIVNSTTERLAPKPKPKPCELSQEKTPVQHFEIPTVFPRVRPFCGNYTFSSSRTCNCCVQELPEVEFVHCTSCDDFDLCKTCFVKDQHGHHPKHAFAVAVEGIMLGREVSRRLSAGRSQRHNAICDGCDKFITGVRNKCLDCPDWDYCADCVLNAEFIHPDHRFVPIYEALGEARVRSASRPVHVGIYCDGPLCSAASGTRSRHIVGDRFKCAVCHDTDFCANCEASPSNSHNKTHPLIKFKTPVRHVSVTTSGEHGNGQRLPVMGDRLLRHQASTSSRATETTLNNQGITTTAVQTVVDVQPSGSSTPVKAEQTDTKTREKEPVSVKPFELIDAAYERDTIADGTVMPPNHLFEQTWVLRNAGPVDWPTGCFVKFIGGDYMGSLDPNHPVGVSELVSASQSTVCDAPIAPGQEHAFTVQLRTPAREGKIISYWRLTTNDGRRFGHKLWCDVNVQTPLKPELLEEEPKKTVDDEPLHTTAESDQGSSSSESQMIFPRLEKESPSASIHEQAETNGSPEVLAEEEAEEFDDCEDDEWADESDDGVVTDEEYDILDASDEEYLEEQQKLLKK